jgi:hypothetical protein
MRLIDLLAVCDENLIVCVWNTQDKFLCEYNGKDSIDETYNNWFIDKVIGSGVDLIDVVVKEEQ